MADRFFEGYSIDDVEALIIQVAQAYQAMEKGQQPALTGDDVVLARFHPTRGLDGYDQVEVDAFFDEIAVDLRRRTWELTLTNLQAGGASRSGQVGVNENRSVNNAAPVSVAGKGNDWAQAGKADLANRQAGKAGAFGRWLNQMKPARHTG